MTNPDDICVCGSPRHHHLVNPRKPVNYEPDHHEFVPEGTPNDGFDFRSLIGAEPL